MKVNVELLGCDDETIFSIECTEEQFAFLQQISELSHETSEYSCMPVMDVKKEE